MRRYVDARVANFARSTASPRFGCTGAVPPPIGPVSTSRVEPRRKRKPRRRRVIGNGRLSPHRQFVAEDAGRFRLGLAGRVTTVERPSQLPIATPSVTCRVQSLPLRYYWHAEARRPRGREQRAGEGSRPKGSGRSAIGKFPRPCQGFSSFARNSRQSTRPTHRFASQRKRRRVASGQRCTLHF